MRRPTETCIYCSAIDKLSDEHIIPEAFGGDQLIKGASCQACASITSRIELRVLRQGYGLRIVRSALKIGRRRPEEKPTSGAMEVVRHGKREPAVLPLSKHLLPIALPLFAQATGPGAPPLPEQIRVLGSHNYALGPPGHQMLAHLGVQEVYFKVRHYDLAFAGLLAKVAYCGWIAEFGISSLGDSWLPSIITGRRGGIGRLVGSLDYALKGLEDPPCIHSIHLGVRERGGYSYAVARVHFLHQLTPSPTYFAILGTTAPGFDALPPSETWLLPRQGQVGAPLKPPLPRWVGTTLYSNLTAKESSPVLEELRGTGLIS